MNAGHGESSEHMYTCGAEGRGQDVLTAVPGPLDAGHQHLRRQWATRTRTQRESAREPCLSLPLSLPLALPLLLPAAIQILQKKLVATPTWTNAERELTVDHADHELVNGDSNSMVYY